MTGKQFLPGSSTIYFDQISKERIYKSIDNISSIRNKYKILIDNAYQLLEKRLGRRPYLEDFYLSHEIDPLLIIQRYGSYYNYLLKSKITDELFDDTGRKILKYLSKKILNGKRNFELLILKELLKNGVEKIENISKSIKCNDDEFRSSIKILNGKFEKNEEMNKLALGYTILDVDYNNIRITDDFAARLDNEEFKRQIEDIIETGLLYYEYNYKESGSDYPFVIGKKYTRFAGTAIVWPSGAIFLPWRVARTSTSATMALGLRRGIRHSAACLLLPSP